MPESSHGSMGGAPGDVNEGFHVEPPEDGFDSDDYREYLRLRDRRRQRSDRRAWRDEDSDGSVSGRHGEDRSNSGPPPEWDGESCSFQDYAIKARLWLATTKSKPRTRGPLLMQKLTKVPFEATKFLAKDSNWMTNPKNGEELIELMDRADYFGDDKEEDLLSSLARVTYHLRRERSENHRAFFGRWDVAMRKVTEHKITLPDLYVGFLMINALQLPESEIKNLLNYTRGSINPKDIREWVRKHETKLQVSQVGVDPKKVTKNNATLYAEETFDPDEEELHSIEEALRDLQGEDGATSVGDPNEDESYVLEEHEAAEVLSMMVQKKKTFMQNLQNKKSRELGRGYRGKPFGTTSSSSSTTSRSTTSLKPGRYHAHLDGHLTVDELKKVTRCGHCKQVGHWWKECPKRKEKEAHMVTLESLPEVESEEATFCGLVEIDEPEDIEPKEIQLVDVPHKLFPAEEDLTCSRLSNDPVTDPVFLPTTQEPVVLDAMNGRESPDQIDVVSARGAYNDRCHDCFHEILFQEGLGNRGPNTPQNPPLVSEDACATIDTGCQRMAIGYETLQKLAHYVPDELSVNLIPQSHKFRSVHGRSSTTHVASIPTSVGPKGSLLRPAVFENEESRNAPFLISLPFLLFCRTVLYLDPQTGLKAHFRKLQFTVSCHLGPSGALRIPLCEFDGAKLTRVKQAQQKFCEQAGEFEVLRVQENLSAPDSPASDCCLNDGAALFEAQPIRSDYPARPAGHVEEDGPQGDVPTSCHQPIGARNVDQEGQSGGDRGVRDDLPALLPESSTSRNLEGSARRKEPLSNQSESSSNSKAAYQPKEKPHGRQTHPATTVGELLQDPLLSPQARTELTSPPVCD